jgi:ADP-L-glycero-D-manno-heptose 6-epimerase
MSSLNGRILVTGGAGFIGSALVWALNQRRVSDIVVTDWLTPKVWKDRVRQGTACEEKKKNLKPLSHQFVDADQFREEIKKDPEKYGRFSAVFHLGASSSTMETDDEYLKDNIYHQSIELTNWALRQGARFIYASSAATYGDGAAGMDDRTEDLSRFKPLNLYGEYKHLFDIYARKQGLLDKIVGLKYFNVFGPNEDHKRDMNKGDMRSLVNKAYQQILSTGRVQLFKSHKPEFKDGEQMRDFLYVKDAIEMTLHFAEHPLGMTAGGLYNLGSGEANTWLTLTRAIFAALGRDPAIDFIDMPEVLRGKYQYFTLADVSKLRATGYARAMTPLTAAVRDYVQNYLVPGKKLGA